MEDNNNKENSLYSFKLKFAFIFWSLFIIGVAAIIFLFYQLSYSNLPTFEELENPKNALASEVYSADGVLLGKYYSENRSNAYFEELPESLVNALIATEDIRFFRHSGIDLRGLVRAIAAGGKRGGGSTITQQLAKNLFHDRPSSKLERVIQKLKEWIISARLEKSYTKKEILTMYLNTVEFSDNAFGIKAASLTYFSKPIDSLNVSESAVLVGMLKAPYAFNPRIHPEQSMDRRNIVLYQMNKYDFLSNEAYDSLKTKPIALEFKETTHSEGLATYFREHLRLELKKWCKANLKVDSTNYDLYKDGLKIYTTIDSRLQKIAENVATEHLSKIQKDFFEHWKGRDPWKDFPNELEKSIRNAPHYKALVARGLSQDSIKTILNTPKEMTIFSWEGEKDTVMTPIDSIRYHRMFLQTGFMVADPKTGAIKAWVGGANYKYYQYDHVLTERQIGSTFKPFLYATAIDNGYSPCFEVLDVPVTFENFDNWQPENSDGKFSGEKMTLKYCLANSINSCSAYLIKQIGPQPVINLVRKLGITSPIDPYPSISLGTPGISVMEMLGSYTAFANKGVYSKPTYISRIEDKNGNLIQEFTSERTEVLSEETAWVMVEMLRDVIQNGTGKRVWLPSYPYQLNYLDIGGKTGTTQNHSDGWFMGITPDLIAGTWVGAEDRFVRFRSLREGQGASTALPIWAGFFKKLYENDTLYTKLGLDPNKKFESPERKLNIELDCSKYQNSDQENFDENNFYGSEFE
ncbi:MAG: transglycosylase domain-containing protein [Chitinophagales bacterium]